jgi:membrane protease YdiL (CAAX protease family)
LQRTAKTPPLNSIVGRLHEYLLLGEKDMNTSIKRFQPWIILLSPFVVIVICNLVANYAGTLWGAWAWLPLALTYWSLLLFLIIWGGGLGAIRRWLQPPIGRVVWSIVAVGTGLLAVPSFVLGMKYLNAVWLPWLIFGLVNPWLEEGYWRGLLLDQFPQWSLGFRIAYSTLLFGISHPLMWGVNSIPNRHIAILGVALIFGFVWSVVYIKTKSLRWAIVGHILADLLTVSVAAFLNLFGPPI